MPHTMQCALLAHARYSCALSSVHASQTKWTVSGVAFFILLTRRDLPVMWAVTGSIMNAAVCKVRAGGM